MSRIYKPIAVKIIIVCLLFCGSALGQQQFVEPDPNNGRPLSVLGMDGMRWEVSIQVYADTDIDVFTTQDSLIASAHSFDKNGQYFVLLYCGAEADWRPRPPTPGAERLDIRRALAGNREAVQEGS